jgi:hypothetical protein
MNALASATRRAKSALRVTLLLHAARGLLALGVAWPLSSAALSDLHPATLALLLPRTLRAAAGPLLLYTGVALLSAPLFALLGLGALSAPTSLRELGARARSHYVAALCLTLLALLATGLAFAGCASAGWSVRQASSGLHDERLRDLLALFVGGASFGVLASWIATLHDTARAALVLGVAGARSAARLALGVAAPGLWLARVASAGVVALLFVLGAFSDSLLVTQLLALVASGVRSLWLAHVIERVTARCESSRS